MSAAVIVGPWGGSGGEAFDDGWNNGGVSKLTIYYQPSILRGIEVTYGNDTSNKKLHGKAVGTMQEIDLSSSTVINISVTVGQDPAFSGDPNNLGVVALGVATSAAPPSFPPDRNGTVIRPQLLGFFGSSSDELDRLGFYLSNP